MPVQFLYRAFENNRKSILYAWFSAMHTRIDVILCHKPEEELKAVANCIGEELTRLEQIANYYNSDSELYRVNQTAHHEPVVLSEELYRMIEQALDYREKTLGCFDVSIQSQNYTKDTWKSITLLPDSGCIHYTQPGVRIDLSGFLKGYALEKVRAMLLKSQIENALVNMGNSSILALGDHPYGKGWKVGFGGETMNKELDILLQNQCLTTSGNDTQDRRHIISPLNGQYIEGIKRIAVVTDNGVEGEVLSTTLLIAPPDWREEFIPHFNAYKIITI